MIAASYFIIIRPVCRGKQHILLMEDILKILIQIDGPCFHAAECPIAIRQTTVKTFILPVIECDSSPERHV
jgi:hypothetical protein